MFPFRTEKIDPDEWTSIKKIEQPLIKRLIFKLLRIEEVHCVKEVRLKIIGEKKEEEPTTAFEYLKFIKEHGYLPMSTEKPSSEASNAEIKRWLKKGSVIINGKKPNVNDIIEIPITELVFFPKGKKKTTMI